MQITRDKGETLRVGQIKTLTTEGTEHTEGETRKNQIMNCWINLVWRDVSHLTIHLSVWIFSVWSVPSVVQNPFSFWDCSDE